MSRAQPNHSPAFELALLQQLKGWLTQRPSSALDALPAADASPPTWLWAETPPLLQQMLARAALRWLVEEGGWRRQPYPDGEQVRQGRLWETAALRGLRMRFSAASPHLLAALTHALCVAQQQAARAPSAEPSDKRRRKPAPDEAALAAWREVLARRAPTATDAEQLGLSLVARALLRQSARGVSPGEPLAAELISALPLTRLWLGALAPPPAPAPGVGDVRCWADAWGWTAPWLADAWSAPWVEADGGALSLGLAHFRHVINHLGVALNHLVDAAEAAERHAWLLPALSFFRRAYAADPAPRLAALAALTNGQRVADRQAVQDAWGHLLRALTRADAMRRALQRTLPADREPHARAFMTYWQAHDLTTTAERVEALRVALERVLG